MTRNRARRERRAGSDERREKRAAELVDAAVRAVRRYGPAVSMDQIATEAGVAKPILYRHFGARNGLVVAIAQRFSDQLRQQLTSALKSPGTDPRGVLRRAIDAHVGLVEREPDVYLFVVEHVGAAAPDGSPPMQSLLQKVGAEVAVVIGEALADAGHDSGVAEPWAFGIVGMVHVASMWWVERRSMSRRRFVESLTTLLWSGLDQALVPQMSQTLDPAGDGAARLEAPA
ncbi:MAG: TetR/AcrR family transcriptional regulator [Acidimicrobiia bacterium]|nr:TetR/AcrR family transcriptional regulator [Acidimicrobiia bacterium]